MAITAKKSRTSDQYNLEARLEQLIHHHLLDLEENPMMYAAKDRLAAIQYIGMFLNRKYGWGEAEGGDVGSSVRKYAGAFRTPPHVVSSRTDRARSARGTERDSAAFSDINPEDDVA